jgi:hypothetical protein
MLKETNWPLIKNFRITVSNETGFPANITWDYISLKSGQEIPSGGVGLDSESEAFVVMPLGFQMPTVRTLVNILPTDQPIAWINGSDVFSQWFYDADLPPNWELSFDSVFKTPKSRGAVPGAESNTYFKPITVSTEESIFHVMGQNYPSPIFGTAFLGTFITYKQDFPGWEFASITNPAPGSLPLELSNNSELTARDISIAILQGFKEEITKQQIVIKNYWSAHLDTFSNQELWGLNRDPWQKILALAPELKPWFSLLATSSLATHPKEPVWFYQEQGSKAAYSRLEPSSWKWFEPSSPLSKTADFGVVIYDINNKVVAQIPPGIEGQSQSAGSLNFSNLSDAYEPTLSLEDFSPPLAINELLPGHRYSWDPASGTPVLPGSAIVIAPGLARIPRTGAWSPTNRNIGFFNSKLSIETINFAFDLLKLTLGKTYGEPALGSPPQIYSSSQDLAQPLRVYEIPTLTVEVGSNIFAADSIIGHEDGALCIRLPLHYKRDSKQWKLAQLVAKAFMPVGLLEIGYHQFTADYSVAGEPVFDYEEPSTIRTQQSVWSAIIYMGQSSPA